MASGSGGGDDGEKIKWMYDGPKSDINREDYLLGKKVGCPPIDYSIPFQHFYR